MKIQLHTRLIAIFSALFLIISLGACKSDSDTDTLEMEEEIPATEVDPVGGGPDDPSNATEGSGTTTSEPSTDPSATEPIDDSTGGGPTDFDNPESDDPGNLQPGADPSDNTMPEDDSATDPIYDEPVDDSVNDPAGGGPTDDSTIDDPSGVDSDDELERDINRELPSQQDYEHDNSNVPGAGS